MGLLLAIPASVYLLWPPKPKKKDPWTEAGRLSELQLDTPAELVFRRNRVDGCTKNERIYFNISTLPSVIKTRANVSRLVIS